MQANRKLDSYPDAGNTIGTAAVAVGGPVRTMHDMLRERLAERDVNPMLDPVSGESVGDRVIQSISRAAGPMILGASYVLIFRLMF